MNSLSDPERVERVVELLTALASGNLAARGELNGSDDEIDAVVIGINMLAEELECSRDELEDRVTRRTAEFAKLNHDIMQLTELSNLLQACESIDEAYAVIAHSLSLMFSDLSGTMYLYKSSRNQLHARASWGPASVAQSLGSGDCWALRRGRRHTVALADPDLSCRHVQDRTGDSVCIPMSAQGEIVGMLHLMDDHAAGKLASPLTEAAQQLGAAVSEHIALALTNLELRERLRMQALRDPLTGLHNRRFVEEWIDREISRAGQSGTSFGVIMADLDHFKRVNDIHGHVAGDMLLKGAADAIRAALRPGDMPCRFGGEEFLVLVTDIDVQTLADRAELVRRRVASLQISYRGVALPSVTISAGIARFPEPGLNASDVVQAADAALYEAKRLGRNRVVIASHGAANARTFLPAA